jgi:spore coat polysaccharide biosynthesis protein SpsF
MPDDRSPLRRIGVVVAARTGSTRLSGKVLRPLGGKPMILFLLERIRHSRASDAVLLATTQLSADDELAEIVAAAGFPVFRGADNDVVHRYVHAAEAHGLDCVVRVTGDCPFVDAESLDYCLARADAQTPFDLASTKGHFPVGIDYEIYSASTMKTLHESGDLEAEEREHLTLFMYRNEARFRLVHLEPRPEWRTNSTFTVDTLEDYRRARGIVDRLGSKVTIAELAGAGA